MEWQVLQISWDNQARRKTKIYIMISFKILVLCAMAGALSAQDAPKPTVEILSEKSFVRADGYDFEFKTSDGVSRKEEAQLITIGDHQGIGVKGSYGYTGPDGQHYLVTFTADDKGFRPVIQTVASGSQ